MNEQSSTKTYFENCLQKTLVNKTCAGTTIESHALTSRATLSSQGSGKKGKRRARSIRRKIWPTSKQYQDRPIRPRLHVAEANSTVCARRQATKVSDTTFYMNVRNFIWVAIAAVLSLVISGGGPLLVGESTLALVLTVVIGGLVLAGLLLREWRIYKRRRDQ